MILVSAVLKRLPAVRYAHSEFSRNWSNWVCTCKVFLVTSFYFFFFSEAWFGCNGDGAIIVLALLLVILSHSLKLSYFLIMTQSNGMEGNFVDLYSQLSSNAAPRNSDNVSFGWTFQNATKPSDSLVLHNVTLVSFGTSKHLALHLMDLFQDRVCCDSCTWLQRKLCCVEAAVEWSCLCESYAKGSVYAYGVKRIVFQMVCAPKDDRPRFADDHVSLCWEVTVSGSVMGYSIWCIFWPTMVQCECILEPIGFHIFYLLLWLRAVKQMYSFALCGNSFFIAALLFMLPYFQTRISNVCIAVYRSLLDALTVAYFIIPEDFRSNSGWTMSFFESYILCICEQTLSWKFQPGGDISSCGT